MAGREPSVSVVVVNWNGRALLESALPSVAALDYPRSLVELVVFDNGSSDGSVAWLRERWPAARVIESSANIGFAAASNRGAAAAGGEVIAFLNNDLRVEQTWLRHMVDALAASGAAAAGSRVLDWEGRRFDFDGAAMNFYGHGTNRGHGYPYAPNGRGALSEPEPALFACGAAMIADRDRFLASGGFDPDYFAYFEDVDLGWRLWVEGERVVYVPAAVAYHRHHGSGLPPERRLRLLEQNALASVVKNYDDANLERVLPAALRLLEVRARLAGEAHAAPYRDTLTGFPEALPALHAKRAAVQGRRRRSDRDIVTLFKEPFRPSFFGGAYWREQMAAVRAFGIASVFGAEEMMAAHGLDDFIGELQRRIEELEGELAAAKRTVAEVTAERDAERTRRDAELPRLEQALEVGARPVRANLWRWLRRCGRGA